jgi:two-component system phosphate regulon response regulator PhoB
MSRKCVLIVATSRSQEFWLGGGEWQRDFDIVIARDAANGIKRALVNLPDIVILDIDIAEREAMVVYQQMAERLPDDRRPVCILKPAIGVPVIISPEGQTVPRPLMAKLDETSRSEPPSDGDGRREDKGPMAVSCHGVKLNLRKFAATVDGDKVDLTATEFRLLWTLASNPGCVFTRRYLAEACHGPGCPSGGRSIDVHIRAIRRKLGDQAHVVETVRGVGYRFRDCSVEPATNGQLACSR